MLSRTTSVASERWSRLLSPYFRAYDKRTGEIVAELEIPAQATSLPMTYMHNGKEYLVFAAGDGKSEHAAELIALTLPDLETQ